MSLDDYLAVLIVLLLPFAWFSTAVLAWAAYKPPRIGALTERAIIALVLALFLTAIAYLVVNSEADSAYLPLELARIAFRASVVALGFVPVAWCVLYFAGRLGESGHG